MKDENKEKEIRNKEMENKTRAEEGGKGEEREQTKKQVRNR